MFDRLIKEVYPDLDGYEKAQEKRIEALNRKMTFNAPFEHSVFKGAQLQRQASRGRGRGRVGGKPGTGAGAGAGRRAPAPGSSSSNKRIRTSRGNLTVPPLVRVWLCASWSSKHPCVTRRPVAWCRLRLC